MWRMKRPGDGLSDKARAMMGQLKRFYADESGAELVEQALLLVLVALVGIGVLIAVRDALTDRFMTILGDLLGLP